MEETEQRKVEFKFPLLTLRTKAFNKVFDKLGKTRFAKFFSWLSLVIVPVVAGFGLFTIIGALVALISTPAAREITRSIGPAAYLLLPGINPVLPFFYGWIGIICAITVHEGAHGIVARRLGLNVKSSGLLFFLIIPIGAFVDVDEEQIAKAKSRDSVRVMAAGVGSNILVAVVSLIVVLVIVNGLTPVVNGVYISSVNSDMPAEKAGLLPKDVLVTIDNITIHSTQDLQNELSTKSPGDIVFVTVARGEKWMDQYSAYVNLTSSQNRTVMGVLVGDLMTSERLSTYENLSLAGITKYLVPPALAPDLVPFSDSLQGFYSSPLGDQWSIWANLFYWLWFVNVNVAVFNALPIHPMDGGRMFGITLKSALGKKIGEKGVSNITIGVTLAMVIILILIFAIPFIL